MIGAQRLLITRRIATAAAAACGGSMVFLAATPAAPASCWGERSGSSKIQAVASSFGNSSSELLETNSKKANPSQSGTSNDSSSMILSEAQIEQIVSMLNGIVQLDSFSDSEQQSIFRHSVRGVLRAVESLLPPAYLKLCRGDHPDVGLSESAAARLFDRLSRAVTSSMSFPYLDEHVEWQIIHCVLDLVVSAMRADASFDDVLSLEHSGPIMMKHFVRGSAGELMVARSKIAETLAEDVQLPIVPLPQSWKLSLATRVVEAVAQQLEVAITQSYELSRDHVNATVDAELSLARCKRAERAAAEAAAAEEAQRLRLLRQRAKLFKVGFRYSHGARGAGTVVQVLEDGVRVVEFDNGEKHRYRPQSQHKLLPIYTHRPTARAHSDTAAEEAARQAHLQSEAAKSKANAEREAAEAEAQRAKTLAEEYARAVAVPFASRVRAHLVASLADRVPSLLPRAATERAVTLAVERALTASFNSEHMSQAVDYMLDQQRLARRLHRVPVGARKLLLQRKEVIFETLLAMDTDGNGELAEAEFLKGIERLNISDGITDADCRALFDAFDLTGRGVVTASELEIMLFGVRLADEHRSLLQRAVVLRRKKMLGDRSVTEGALARAEHEAEAYSHHEETARQQGRLASLMSLIPLAAIAGVASGLPGANPKAKQDEQTEEVELERAQRESSGLHGARAATAGKESESGST